MTDFDPDFPNATAKRFRDKFVASAESKGLTDIPSDILNWAIDRAIRSRVAAEEAGATFANVYYRIHTRREPRGGYGSPTANLLGVFEKILKGERLW